MQDAVKHIELDVTLTDQVEDLENSTCSNDDGLGGTNLVDSVNVESSLVHQDGLVSYSQTGQLSHCLVDVQHTLLTGRRGEEVVFDYYKKGGIKLVKWVNEDSETGLPYDIEVYDEENRKEYIEVKTTDSGKKDWFEISVREWQFAVEKGELYSIARVVLSGSKKVRVAIFKNPVRLCRLGQLKLAVLMPTQQKDEFVQC